MYNYQTFANKKSLFYNSFIYSPETQDVSLLLHEMLNFGEYELYNIFQFVIWAYALELLHFAIQIGISYWHNC